MRLSRGEVEGRNLNAICLIGTQVNVLNVDDGKSLRVKFTLLGNQPVAVPSNLTQ